MAGKCIYKRRMLGGIELHVFEPREIRNAPVVFVLHPFTANARLMFGYCRDLVKKGFTAITFDLRNHGRRLVDRKRNNGWRKGNEAEFFSLIVDMYGYLLGTAQDISLLLDLMPARFGYKLDNVGVTGFSLGGHASLIAMANDARIKTGAAVIGSGDFKTLMKLRWERYGYPVEQFEKRFEENLGALIEKHDPVCKPDVFAGRPLLMANGGKDILVPLVCNQNFYQRVAPYYPDKEKVKLSVYPEIGHRIYLPMWHESLDWLEKWLIKL